MSPSISHIARAAIGVLPHDVALAVPVEIPSPRGGGEDPCRADAGLVEASADERGVAVGRERHGPALLRAPHRARADQLDALLGPDAAVPGPHPRGPELALSLAPANDGRVAVGRRATPK